MRRGVGTGQGAAHRVGSCASRSVEISKYPAWIGPTPFAPVVSVPAGILCAMTTNQAEAPYRVVDVTWQGWHHKGGGVYGADFGFKQNLADSTLEQIDESRGPWRPVVPVSEGDAQAVRAALRQAKRKAAASVLVALFQLVDRYAKAAYDKTDPHAHKLQAGREGSRETHSMRVLAWEVGCDLAEKPKRYNETTVAELVRVIEIWVTGPDHYVEVAETLARLFGQVADEVGGWGKIADRWSQLGPDPGHPELVKDAVHHFLMSASVVSQPELGQ